jgi:hypothetical protein
MRLSFSSESAASKQAAASANRFNSNSAQPRRKSGNGRFPDACAVSFSNSSVRANWPAA